MKTNLSVISQKTGKKVAVANHWITRQTHFARFLNDYEQRSEWLPDFPEPPVCDPSASEAELAASVAIFQLGESSEGRTLKRQGFRRVMDTGDWDYLETLQLFIKEEQQHAAWLGKWLDRHHFLRLKSHPTDHFFRALRHLFGLELSLITLCTAEILAVPYYRAVMQLTSDPYLKAVCKKILKDEARHLRFQQAAIAHFLGKQNRLMRFLARVYAHLALEGAVLLVHLEHRKVWQGTDMSWMKLRHRCKSIVYEFRLVSLFSK